MPGQKAPQDREHSADTLSEFHSERTSTSVEEREREATLSFDKGDAEPDARYGGVELNAGFDRKHSDVPAQAHLLRLRDEPDPSFSTPESVPVVRRKGTSPYAVIFAVLILAGV